MPETEFADGYQDALADIARTLVDDGVEGVSMWLANNMRPGQARDRLLAWWTEQ